MTQQPRKRFASIDWGPDEARGDIRLMEYFVSIPAYPQLLEGKLRYIIGRKGSGKTALLQRISLESDRDPEVFSTFMSLRDFPLNLMENLRITEYAGKSQFVPAWTFLIAVEVARLILQDNSAQPAEDLVELEKFLEQNFPNPIHGVSNSLKAVSKSDSSIVLPSKWLSSSSSSETQTSTAIHYEAATDAILSIIAKIRSNCKFYLLIDELDEGFDANNNFQNSLLLALIRATENISQRFSGCQTMILPILALRSDIFDRLEDNDLNKLDDYLVRLEWTSTPSGPLSFRGIVNARIAASLSGDGKPGDPWAWVVRDNDPNLPDKLKSMWTVMVNQTFNRPRDILKYLKLCQSTASIDMLDWKTLDRTQSNFSDWLYKELRDEIHTHLPVWRNVLAVISSIGKGKLDLALLNSSLEKDDHVAKWLKESGRPVSAISEILFRFGVIGNFDNRSGFWRFRYRDNDIEFNPRSPIIVHFGFHRKLLLRHKE